MGGGRNGRRAQITTLVRTGTETETAGIHRVQKKKITGGGDIPKSKGDISGVEVGGWGHQVYNLAKVLSE